MGTEREGGVKREGWRRGKGRGGRKGSGEAMGREGESHAFQFCQLESSEYDSMSNVRFRPGLRLDPAGGRS